VTLTGTMRAFSEQARERAIALMRETLQHVTAAYGGTYELTIQESIPVTFNEPALVEEMLPTIRRIVGAENALAIKPFMPAEDFSYFQKGITAGWHTPEFDVDEESLVVGVRVMSNVLLDYLERHATERGRN
jgi:metal-dependent amidase/aminoacylase/carboxypeptidase family protein